MNFFRSRFFVACVASTTTAFVVGGVAWAVQSPVDGAGVIHACYAPNTGAITLNVKGAPCPVKGKSVPLTWNEQGPPGAQGLPGTTGPQGPAGPAPILAAVPVPPLGGFLLTSGTWNDLPFASTTISVPTDTTATVVARFTVVINTLAPGNGGNAMLRITLDGQPMQLDDPANSVNGVYYGQHVTFEKSLSGVSAGDHTVQVQASLGPCPSGCFQTVNMNNSELVVEGAARVIP